jgi:uncharacterized OB-fold protein
MPDLRPDADYQAFLREGRFMIQRSRGSGDHVFYPRLAAPGAGRADLEWVEATGEGTVYSTTVVRNREPAADYNVALVELAEGPRLMSRVIGLDPPAVSIGLKVRARIVELDGGPAVVFEPAEPAA